MKLWFQICLLSIDFSYICRVEDLKKISNIKYSEEKLPVVTEWRRIAILLPDSSFGQKKVMLPDWTLRDINFES